MNQYYETRKLHISLKQKKKYCDKQRSMYQINNDNRFFVDVKCNTTILQLKSNSQYKIPPFHVFFRGLLHFHLQDHTICFH